MADVDDFTRTNAECNPILEEPGYEVTSLEHLWYFDYETKTLIPKTCEMLGENFCADHMNLSNGVCINGEENQVATCDCPNNWRRELFNEGQEACIQPGPCEINPCSGHANTHCVETEVDFAFDCVCNEGYEKVENSDDDMVYGCKLIEEEPIVVTEEPVEQPITPPSDFEPIVVINDNNCAFNEFYDQVTEKCSCDNGWILDEESNTCIDDNECDGETYAGRHCSEGQWCRNYIGGYMCYDPRNAEEGKLTCHHRAEPVPFGHQTISRSPVKKDQILSGFDLCSCFDDEAYQSRCYGTKCFLVGWRDHQFAINNVLSRAWTRDSDPEDPEVFECPEGQFPYKYACYEYISTPATVADANSHCESLDEEGSLAIIWNREMWYLLGQSRNVEYPQFADAPFWFGDLNYDDNSLETLEMFIVETKHNYENQAFAFVSTMQDIPSVYVVDADSAKFSYFCKFGEGITTDGWEDDESESYEEDDVPLKDSPLMKQEVEEYIVIEDVKPQENENDLTFGDDDSSFEGEEYDTYILAAEDIDTETAKYYQRIF